MAKLSQEAFRLLRTVQNLLTLKEPTLAELKNPFAAAAAPASSSFNSFASIVDIEHNDDDDSEETVHCPTPSTAAHNKPATIQRKTNYRVSRLSMQSSTDDSVHSSSSASSRHETDEELLLTFGSRACNSPADRLQPSTSYASPSTSSTMSSFTTSSAAILHRDCTALQHSLHKTKHLLAISPKITTMVPAINTADDESGFSSINSFQDIGLPHHSPPPQMPPRSRVSSESLLLPEISQHALASTINTDEESDNNITLPYVCLRRWSSVPAPPIPPKRILSTFNGSGSSGDSNEPLQVLWV